MEALIVVLLLVLLGSAAIATILGWQFLTQRERPEQEAETAQLARELAVLKSELTQVFVTTQQSTQQTMLGQVNALDQKMNQRLDAVQQGVTKSLENQTDVMGRIGQQLGGLEQSAKRMLDVGEDVTALKDVLQPPKVRGIFGELLLEQLLSQVLPADHFTMQHRFNNGTMVDAVIKTPHGLVPVDSKFPLDSYRRLHAAPAEEREQARRAFIRDVKARVEEVAKYIQPGEDTLDFACMYIPSEAVFYEIIAGTEEDSMTFALERQVHLASPNTFYALLQMVARNIGRQRVHENIKEFTARVAQIRKDFGRFQDEFGKLGTHMSHASNKYAELNKWVDKLDNSLAVSTGETGQPSLLEEPLSEDVFEGVVAEEPPVPEPLRLRIGDDAQ